MKHKIYGIIITTLSVLLAAVFVFKETGGLSLISLFNRETKTADYVDGDYIGYVSPESDPVTDGESAVAAAAKIFNVDKDELSVELEDDTELNGNEKYYKLQQMSGELPVYGRRVNLSVDDGKLYLVSGSLSGKDYDIDTTPSINEDTALESVRSYVVYTLLDGYMPEDFQVSLSLFDDENLCIYDQGEYADNPRLAYDCVFTYSGGKDEIVSGSYDVLIDAHNSEILSASGNVYAATVGLNYTVGDTTYYAELEQDGDNYVFRDEMRNMQLYNAEDVENSYMFKSGKYISADDRILSSDDVIGLEWYNKDTGMPIEIYTMPTDSTKFRERTPEGRAFKLLAHAQASYDFYWKVLGRKGFNNGNGQMNLAINHKFEGKGAYSYTEGNTNLIAVEYTESSLLAMNFTLDTMAMIAHEFTHAVEATISGMDYDFDESGALMEGYSDTFSTIAEAYTNGEEPAWTCAGRDMSADKIYDYTDYRYKYSYFVSHRAYLIWNDWTEQGIGFSEKIDDISHLFYRALYLLDKYATFDQWYWAMEQVAQYMFQTGELTEKQLDAVIDRLGTERRENEDIENNFELIETVAVLLAQEYERSGATKLSDNMRELASITMIPLIRIDLQDHVGLNSKTVAKNTDGEVEIHEKTIFYYLASLFGEDYADSFTGSNYYTHEGNSYKAYYRSPNDVCGGWSWKITKTELLDDINVGYYAMLVSPDGTKYEVKFLLSQDEGGYTGAFLNGYYLCDMGLKFDDNDEILTNWLEGMVETSGVIEVGTEEYYSQSGNFEHVIPAGRLTGLLAADMDDYDGDGSNELFVVRADPENYHLGNANGTSTIYIMLEIYDVKNGEVVLSDSIFPVIGLPETEYQVSAHIFKMADEDGVKLYFDHYFNFNSQTFAVIQLEYNGEGLFVTDGAELDEYAYSSGCYQAVSNEACGTILGRQSYDIGEAGWEETESGYWESYDKEFEDTVADTLARYSTLLRDMGLTDTVTRSMFAGRDDKIFTSLQDIYSRCCLKPAEHYTCDSGNIEGICSVAAPYGQGSVTLIVNDETELLYPYRTGGASSNLAYDNTESENDADVSVANGGYDSAGDVFFAFTDILMNGDAEDVLSLYYERQLLYTAEKQGCELSYLKNQLEDDWRNSWDTMTDDGTWQYELKEVISLEIGEIHEKFGSNSVTPDEAKKLKIVAQTVLDKTFYIYAVCYDGRWYLSVVND